MQNIAQQKYKFAVHFYVFAQRFSSYKIYCVKCTNLGTIFCKVKELLFSLMENNRFTYNVKYKCNCGVVLINFTLTNHTNEFGGKSLW